MSDFLPDDRELWIRKLSSSPGISFYDYNDFASVQTWNPIFGTAGTSNATNWSGLMWHFGAAAQPGTNTYAAVFEIYVVNTTTGAEVTNSSSGPFELSWTSVPDGRPELTISRTDTNHIIVAWPASATNWSLACSTNLPSVNWMLMTNLPVGINGQSTVYLESGYPQQFFRLRRNP